VDDAHDCYTDGGETEEASAQLEGRDARVPSWDEYDELGFLDDDVEQKVVDMEHIHMADIWACNLLLP